MVGQLIDAKDAELTGARLNIYFQMVVFLITIPHQEVVAGKLRNGI